MFIEQKTISLLLLLRHFDIYNNNNKKNELRGENKWQKKAGSLENNKKN